MRGSMTIKVIALLAGVSFLAMVFAGWALLSQGSQAAEEQERAEMAMELERRAERRVALRNMQIADFALVDQRGEPVTQRMLEGRYTVLSFMFSYCTLACPIMSGNMYRVYMEGPPHVRLLSMSVDPVNDTPERLAEYAENLKVAAPKWRMLSGPEKVVMNVARSLGLGFELDPSIMIDMGDGREMANIIHPTRFILFGPDGKIIDSYSGMEREDVDRLLLDLRALPVPSEAGE